MTRTRTSPRRHARSGVQHDGRVERPSGEDDAGVHRPRPQQGANYASVGNGTSLHLAGAQFTLATGLKPTHVPYRETTAANSDGMGGRVEVMFQTPRRVTDKTIAPCP
jgi:hypothetical protein